MAHITEVVEIRELNDELSSYRVRCCGEELTDQWCTVNVNVPDHSAIDQTVADHAKRIADRHERKQQWRKKEKAKMEALAAGQSIAVEPASAPA